VVRLTVKGKSVVGDESGKGDEGASPW
jgi:hypothetical protein